MIKLHNSLERHRTDRHSIALHVRNRIGARLCCDDGHRHRHIDVHGGHRRAGDDVGRRPAVAHQGDADRALIPTEVDSGRDVHPVHARAIYGSCVFGIAVDCVDRFVRDARPELRRRFQGRHSARGRDEGAGGLGRVSTRAEHARSRRCGVAGIRRRVDGSGARRTPSWGGGRTTRCRRQDPRKDR